MENIAAKRQKLFNDIFAASGVAQKYNCALKRLDYQQEQGLMSSLALGTYPIEIERGLTTSSTAMFVPFTTCELFQEGEALYYGLNALSNNLIMVHEVGAQEAAHPRAGHQEADIARRHRSGIEGYVRKPRKRNKVPTECHQQMKRVKSI